MNLTDVVAIVSAFGVIGALIFNGITLRKDQKTRYFSFLQDLQNEFIEIAKRNRDVMKWDDSSIAEVLVKSPNDLVAINEYRWEFLLFHEKIAHFAIRKVISEEIAQYFRTTFSLSIRYVELSTDPDLLKSKLEFLYKWCEKEKITSKDDS